LPSSLSYMIENIDGIPKIVWGGVSSHTADALLAIPSSPEEKSALEDANEFLREALLNGAVDSKEVLKQAREAGIAERTLHRAKKVMCVVSKKAEFKSGWLWVMPSEGCQNDTKVAIKNNGNLGGDLATFGNLEGIQSDLKEVLI